MGALSKSKTYKIKKIKLTERERRGGGEEPGSLRDNRMETTFAKSVCY